MPITVNHVLTATTPDNTSYEIRPSHWNSAHAFTINATGSEISGAFSNANGISFGVSGGAITGSYTQSAQAFSAAGGSSTFSTLNFADSNGISFSNSNGSLIASHNGLTSQSNQAFSAQGGSSTFQTLGFSNANGLTFSNSNGSVVGSYTVPTQTNQTIGVYGSSNTTGQSSSSTVDARSLTFRGAGIASVGMSAGEVVVSVPSAGASVNFSAGTTSNNLNAVTFGNANGVSFGLNASTITGSVAAQTNQSIGVYASSQTTGQSSSSTVDARSLTVVGRGIISVGMSGGALHISASAAGAADGYNMIAAGTQTANTTGTVVFSNANGVSFGMSNSSIVTASHNGLTSQSNQALSGSNGSFTFQTATFGNLNGLSFYTSNGSVVGSYTTPDVGTVSAGTSIATLGQILLADSNGISFGASDNTITASYNPFGAGISGGNTAGDTGTVSRRVFLAGGANITLSGSTNGGSQTVSIVGGGGAQSNQTLAIYALGNTTGQSSSSTYDARTLSMEGAGIVSVGWSAGSVRVSATQSNQAVSGSNGSFTFQTLSLSNANGISFGSSAGPAITASYTVPGTLSVFAQSNTTQSSSGTIPFNSLQFHGAGAASVGVSNGSVIVSVAAGAQSNQTLGLYATGNTTQNSSTTFDARTLGTMNGLGAMTVGFSNGSIQLSAPATSSLSATGQVSISTNGSTISIGVPNPSTQDGFNPYPDVVHVLTQAGQGTLQIDPQGFPNCQFDRILFPIHNTNSSNSSGSHTISVNVGLYTKNASTLSLYTSWQGTTALTHSGTVGSYSFFSGLRQFSFAANGTIPQGRYWIGVNSVTTSGGANGSYSNLVLSAINSNFSGIFGASHATTAQLTLGQGIYTATTNGMPSSIAFSQIRGSDSQAQRPPVIGFAMGTA